MSERRGDGPGASDVDAARLARRAGARKGPRGRPALRYLRQKRLGGDGGGPAFGRDYVDEAFNSRHSSGWTHFVFADGSVRGYVANIDPALRAQLGVRNDGLPLGNP